MPFLTSVGSAASFGFGLSSGAGTPPVYTYFYDSNATSQAPGSWSVATNWYTDNLHTINTVSPYYPQILERAKLLSHSHVFLDGWNDIAGTTGYHSWEELSYWAPAAKITSDDQNLTCESLRFKEYPNPTGVPNFQAGTYSLGNIVRDGSAGSYYEFIANTTMGPIQSTALDDNKWGLIGPNRPYIDNVDLGDGNLTALGVLLGQPV